MRENQVGRGWPVLKALLAVKVGQAKGAVPYLSNVDPCSSRVMPSCLAALGGRTADKVLRVDRAFRAIPGPPEGVPGR